MRTDDELDDPGKPEYRGTSNWPLIVWVGLCILAVTMAVVR